jgi:hypothetical protein
MMEKATPDKRKPLEERIVQQWHEVQARKDTDGLRQFVALFGPVSGVGHEARFQLAERLIEERTFLEAELHLLQLRRLEDPRLAGRAVEALARLMMQKGLLEDAAYWYRLLGREFAQVIVRANKTGGDFFNEMAADKRLLAYLDEPHSAWGNVRLKAKEVASTNQGAQPPAFSLGFEPEGEMLPFFERNRLVMQNNSQVKLVDRLTNEERWSQEVMRSNNFLYNNYNGYTPSIRYPYRVQGHLIVLNVGLTVYGFDPVDHKKLWEQNLYGSGVFNQNPQPMPDGNGNLQLTFADGFFHRLGQTGPAEASYVCMNTREGLKALDPIKGTVLWTKSGVPQRTRIFGDDQHAYLVEVRADGGAGASMALRARDGVAVKVPEFASLFPKHIRILGRNLLLKETGPRGDTVLRLYDVHTGKDLWTQSFKSPAVVLRSEDPYLVGAIEPANEGKVTILDLRTKKELLVTKIDAKYLDKVQEVHLLDDPERFYLAISKTANPAVNNPWGGPGGPFPNVLPGLRCVMANGRILAFNKATREFEWHQETPDQMLIVDQFRELPVLLLTALQQRPNVVGGLNRGGAPTAVARSIEKRTGKLLFDKEYANRNTGNQFHTIKADVQAGTVELIGYNMKIVHYTEGSSAGKEEGTKTGPIGPVEPPNVPRIPKSAPGGAKR